VDLIKLITINFNLLDTPTKMATTTGRNRPTKSSPQIEYPNQIFNLEMEYLKDEMDYLIGI
jgi:hypothetical protein